MEPGGRGLIGIPPPAVDALGIVDGNGVIQGVMLDHLLEVRIQHAGIQGLHQRILSHRPTEADGIVEGLGDLHGDSPSRHRLRFQDCLLGVSQIAQEAGDQQDQDR